MNLKKKAIGMHVFCGSQTIGHMLEGWDVTTILEMTDDMLECNAYHFHKNYPNIDIKLPKDYENNNEYLEKLKDEHYDLLFSNPPCSGLSQINRNANVDNDINQNIYKVISMVNTICPKIFFIENAPTLTSTGLPILKDIVKILGDKYYICIINDCGKNHNVAMYRRRTFVIGFSRSIFNECPLVDMKIEKDFLVEDVLKNVDYTYNKEFVNDAKTDLFKYYKYVKPGSSILITLANDNRFDEELDENLISNVHKIRDKQLNNKNIWDKSPWRPCMNGRFPSLTSITKIIHPIEDRDLYVREYAAIMGFPNDFIFYQDECKTPILQCIAQGVPVNFIRYISGEMYKSFDTDKYISGDVIYINQTNVNNRKIFTYTISEFLNIDSLLKSHSTIFTNRCKLW